LNKLIINKKIYWYILPGQNRVLTKW